MKRPELLAPVGSKEALVAAVDNGADAVYFGGTLFSARQFASNFRNEELEESIDYAHIRGVLAYVTVNTLIKDSELEAVSEYLQFLCNAGVDAVIVQDMGILRLLRERLPLLPIHASTQMTIHNVEGVKLLQEMGVKRVVLAREMTLDEIKSIKSQADVEIETFIHGALCFSYSGQCLLSSIIGGRSGNRGYCAQPCRKKYRMNEKEGYLLSTKDLNMSENIESLINAGIDSFKIEGRMKRPEYVAGVVRVYRKLIDRYLEAPGEFHVTEEEKHTLLQLFNREFTTGYFFNNPGNKLMSGKYPHNRGTDIGKVIDYDPGTRLVSIHLEAPLRTGDGVGIGNRETGITVRQIYSGKKIVNEADSGSNVKIPIDIDVTGNEDVFKTFDSRLMSSLELGTAKKIPIIMSLRAKIHEPLELSISDNENEAKIRGDIVKSAMTKPVTKRSISEQLIKLGGTVFGAKELNFDLDRNIFIPVSELNSIRREAIGELVKMRSGKKKRQCSKPLIPTGSQKTEIKPILSVNAGSIEAFKAAVDGRADVVYIGDEILYSYASKPQINTDEYRFADLSNYRYAIDYAHKKGVRVFINTPRIIKDMKELDILNLKSSSDASDLIEESDGFLVRNTGIYYNIIKNFMHKDVVIDYPLNIFNRLTMDYFSHYSKRVTLSPELSLKEIRNIAPYGFSECIVHGYFPLMVSEHDLIGCLFKANRPAGVFLKDEKGFGFPVMTDMHKRTYVMNSRELCLLGYVSDIIKSGVCCLRIEAGKYDAKRTGEITREYREAVDDAVSGIKSGKRCVGKYTTGNYFRSVI